MKWFTGSGHRVLCRVVALVMAVTSVPPTPVWAAPSAPLDLHRLTIPDRLGYLDEVWQPDEGPPQGIVIHIRDLHVHPEAQQHISELLGYLHDRYGVELVAVEGAAGRCETELYSDFPDPPSTERIAKLFVEEGLFTGAEFYGVTHPARVTLWGAEDEALYERHLSVYHRNAADAEPFRRTLSELSPLLASLREALYSEPLKRLTDARAKFDAEELTFLGYVRQLSDLAAQHQLSLNPYPALQALGDAKAKHEPSALLAEAETLAAALQERLLATDDQRQLARLTQWHVFARALVESQLQPAEWDQFQAVSQALSPAAVWGFLVSHHDQLSQPLSDGLEHDLSDLFARLPHQVEFYTVAHQRDDALVRNTVSLLHQRTTHDPPRATVLIAGGFHTRGITERLKRQHIAYAVISPAFSGAMDESRYRARLNDEVPSLQELMKRLEQQALVPPLATSAPPSTERHGQAASADGDLRRQTPPRLSKHDEVFKLFVALKARQIGLDGVRQWIEDHGAEASEYQVAIATIDGLPTVTVFGETFRFDSAAGGFSPAAKGLGAQDTVPGTAGTGNEETGSAAPSVESSLREFHEGLQQFVERVKFIATPVPPWTFGPVAGEALFEWRRDTEGRPTEIIFNAQRLQALDPAALHGVLVQAYEVEWYEPELLRYAEAYPRRDAERPQPTLTFGYFQYRVNRQGYPLAARLTAAESMEHLKVLDAGAGDGWLSYAMFQRLADVTAVDDSAAYHALATEYFARSAQEDGAPVNIPYHESRLSDLSSLPAETFDLTTIVNTLYLLPDGLRHLAVRQMWNRVKPSGQLVIAEAIENPLQVGWIDTPGSVAQLQERAADILGVADAPIEILPPVPGSEFVIIRVTKPSAPPAPPARLSLEPGRAAVVNDGSGPAAVQGPSPAPARSTDGAQWQDAPDGTLLWAEIPTPAGPVRLSPSPDAPAGYYEVRLAGERIDEQPLLWEETQAQDARRLTLRAFYLRGTAQYAGVGRAIIRWLAQRAATRGLVTMQNQQTSNPHVVSLMQEVLEPDTIVLEIWRGGQWQRVAPSTFLQAVGVVSFYSDDRQTDRHVVRFTPEGPRIDWPRLAEADGRPRTFSDAQGRVRSTVEIADGGLTIRLLDPERAHPITGAPLAYRLSYGAAGEIAVRIAGRLRPASAAEPVAPEIVLQDAPPDPATGEHGSGPAAGDVRSGPLLIDSTLPWPTSWHEITETRPDEEEARYRLEPAFLLSVGQAALLALGLSFYPALPYDVAAQQAWWALPLAELVLFPLWTAGAFRDAHRWLTVIIGENQQGRPILAHRRATPEELKAIYKIGLEYAKPYTAVLFLETAVLLAFMNAGVTSFKPLMQVFTVAFAGVFVSYWLTSRWHRQHNQRVVATGQGVLLSAHDKRQPDDAPPVVGDTEPLAGRAIVTTALVDSLLSRGRSVVSTEDGQPVIMTYEAPVDSAGAEWMTLSLLKGDQSVGYAHAKWDRAAHRLVMERAYASTATPPPRPFLFQLLADVSDEVDLVDRGPSPDVGVWVDSAIERQGYGTSLLQAIIALGRRQGAQRIQLDRRVVSDAKPFYARLGFQEQPNKTWILDVTDAAPPAGEPSEAAQGGTPPGSQAASLRSVDEILELLRTRRPDLLDLDGSWLADALAVVRAQQPRRVLVAGAGILPLPVALSLMGVEVVFVDLEPLMIEAVRNSVAGFSDVLTTPPHFLQANMDTIDRLADPRLQTDAYDMVLLLSLVGGRFQGDPARAIENSYRLVRSGGLVFLPNQPLSGALLGGPMADVTMAGLLSVACPACVRAANVPSIRTRYDEADAHLFHLYTGEERAVMNDAYVIIKTTPAPPAEEAAAGRAAVSDALEPSEAAQGGTPPSSPTEKAEAVVVAQITAFLDTHQPQKIVHPEEAGGTHFGRVMLYPDIGLVEKGTRSASAIESIELAKKNLGGLTAGFVSVREGEVEKIWMESLPSLKTVMERFIGGGRVAEASQLLRKFFETNIEIMKRGIVNWDPKIENYGVTASGDIVLLDIGGLVKSEDVLTEEDTDDSNVFFFHAKIVEGVPSELGSLFNLLRDEFGLQHGGAILETIRANMGKETPKRVEWDPIFLAPRPERLLSGSLLAPHANEALDITKGAIETLDRTKREP